MNILPLGSLVSLRKNNKKIMIIGRGSVFHDVGSGQDLFADYIGIDYPTGFDSNSTTFFNNEDISNVLFKGFSNEQEVSFLQLYASWREKMLTKYPLNPNVH